MKKDFGMNEQELNTRLDSASQRQMREVVKALPEETLSLAWRSELNAKLREGTASQQRSRRFGWAWKPAAGLVAASALAFTLVFHQPSPAIEQAAAGSGLEKALVNHYVDSTASWEVAGDGVTVNEVKEAASANPVPVDNNDQEDVGAIL